jgi:hypothetical protein
MLASLSMRMLVFLATLVFAYGTDITTAQIDASRTMVNDAEIYLTTANVNGSKFGKLFARTVDGAIFGQPLFLQALKVRLTRTIRRQGLLCGRSHWGLTIWRRDGIRASAS